MQHPIKLKAIHLIEPNYLIKTPFTIRELDKNIQY
jgi:hypothetical protein